MAGGRGLTRPWAHRIGLRTLLAASCHGCGALMGGAAFGRNVRRAGEPAYLDLRCTTCKWGAKVNGNGNGRRS